MNRSEQEMMSEEIPPRCSVVVLADVHKSVLKLYLNSDKRAKESSSRTSLASVNDTRDSFSRSATTN